ncbi:MAG: 2-iminobutanoate/2-iminopropanoate deaminase [Roseivirga sp.]|jgi:2-iminobutanoate/2-iminopropanoate deaminase
MKVINAKNAPKALGPYCSAIRTGNLLFCSGQTGIDPQTNNLASAIVEGQTAQVLENLRSVLMDQGLSPGHVVKCNVYLTDMANFQKMNQVYGDFFEAHTPARTTVAVAGLPLNALVEIECIAEFL